MLTLRVHILWATAICAGLLIRFSQGEETHVLAGALGAALGTWAIGNFALYCLPSSYGQYDPKRDMKNVMFIITTIGSCLISGYFLLYFGKL